MSTPPLSIFLVKEGVSNDDLLEKAHAPAATSVQVGHVPGTLYTRSVPEHPPSWTSFFEGRIDADALHLNTSSASALLVVPMKNRTFAVAFGYGRHLLNPLAVESTFGLRATLNAVSIDSIRSIDKKTFEGISTHTREQASKETSIGDFGLNVERDVVSAVTGTPTDATLGKQLTGKDALKVQCVVKIDGLPELLQAFYAKSQEGTYKKHFPWIDNIVEVRDKARRDKLDLLLVDSIRAGGTPRIWLAIPQLVDWADIAGFAYSRAKSAKRFPDVHLRDYLACVPPDAISEEALKRRRVIGYRVADDAEVGPWPVYQCIHAEIAVGSETYLLNGGEWYQIDNDFVAVVDKAIAAIPQMSFVPIDYIAGEHEAQYNMRLSASIAGACCPDRDVILHGGGRSRVEFCDVYSPARQMIHVKRYGAASVLSHLFAQGLVSATTFLSDERFREKVNGLLPSQLRIDPPEARPNAADFEIAFVVASRSAGPLSLPFFSRVTLRHAYTQLANYGFRATLTKVQIT